MAQFINYKFGNYYLSSLTPVAKDPIAMPFYN